jgi:hypothetical protein
MKPDSCPVKPDLPGATSAEITPIARVLWLSPSTPAERSVELVARVLEGRADIVPKELEVWANGPLVSYTIDDEVEGSDVSRKIVGGRSFISSASPPVRRSR